MALISENTVDSVYHQQQNKWYPLKGFYLPMSKLHSILAVANLLAHINIYNYKLLWASKFATAKIVCSFEMGK